MSHRDKQVFYQLFKKYHKSVRSISSWGCSSPLRTKRFLKIQNPIKFEDFMAKRLFEYHFTETLNFSVFLSNMCILIQFLKAIGWWTHQTLCLFQPCEYLVIKKLNFRVIEYDLKNLWLNTVVTRTKRHGVTWKTTNFQHPILWMFKKPEEKKICLMYLLYQSHLRLMSKEFFSMKKYSKRQKN